MTLFHSPSVQSPAGWDKQNLTQAGMRSRLQDSGYRYNIHPSETAAGLVAADLAFGFDVGDLRRYKIVGAGGDETVLLQKALNGCNGRLYWPAVTVTTSATVNAAAGTQIICDPGATLTALAASWAIAGWPLINAKGSLIVQGLTISAPAAARNTSWKAITCDNGVQALAAGTRLIARDLVISNLDIGVYADGGAAARISYAEVSGSQITINTAGTGGAGSIRPTVNLNECGEAVVLDNALLDASDRINSVNNIYCIGCGKLTVEGNYILSGTVKCLSNANFAVDSFILRNNRLQGIPWVQCQVDTNPIKFVEVDSNHFDTPVTQAGDVACVIFTNLTNCASVSYPFVRCAGNYFANVPYSCYYVAPSATNSFGALVLEGNHYDDTSTGSAGSNAVVNFTTNGAAYRSLIAANESVYGNTHTRSYLQAAAYGAGNPFTLVQLSSIEETSIAAAKTGAVIKTCVLTLGGCTTAPTVTATYTIRDGVVTMTVPSVSATSNTTAMSLNGLPAECEPAAATSQVSMTGNDNGAFTNNLTAQVQPATSSITFAKNGSTAGFTNAGVKGSNNFTMSWPLG